MMTCLPELGSPFVSLFISLHIHIYFFLLFFYFILVVTFYFISFLSVVLLQGV
jgi:hypothetical protein